MVHRKGSRPLLSWLVAGTFVCSSVAWADPAYDLGLNFYQQKSYAFALSQFEKAVTESAHPSERVSSQWYRASCLERLGREQEALKAFQDFAASHPQHTFADQAVFHAALIHYRSSTSLEGVEAVPVMEAVVDRLKSFHANYPNSQLVDEAAYWRGEALYRLGRDAEAADAYQQVVASPSATYRTYARYSQGRAWFRLKQFAQAEQAFRDVLAGTESTLVPVAHYWGAECAYQQGRLDEAEKALRTAVTSGLSLEYEELASARLAELLVKRGQYAAGLAASEDFLKAFGHRPSKFAVAYWKGVALLETGKSAEAVGAFDEYIQGASDPILMPYALYAKGVALYRLQRWPEAVEAWRQGTQRYAEHAMGIQSTHALATLLYQLGRYGEAKEQFEQLLTAVDVEFRASALYWTGWCEAKLKAYREAELTFKTFVDRFPAHRFVGEAYVMLGELAFGQKSWKEARAWYLRAQDPSAQASVRGLAFEGLGWVEIKAEKWDAAIKCFKQAAALADDDGMKVRIGRTLSDLLFNQRRYAEALEEFKKLSSAALSEKDRRDARRQWGWCELSLERVDQAVKVWDELASDEGQWLIGQAYMGNNRHAEAAKAFRGLIDRYPKSQWAAQSLIKEGDALYNMQVFDAAIRSYRAALDREALTEGQRQEALHGLALAYERTGRVSEEIAVKRQYVTSYPKEEISQRFQWDIGDRLLNQGDVKHALAQYESAVKLAPLASGWLKIAQCHVSLATYPEAINAYQQNLATMKGRGRVEGLVGVASVYMKTGQWEAAAAPLKELYEGEVDSVKPWAARQLGQAYQALGKRDEAGALWQWVVAKSADAALRDETRWTLMALWMEMGKFPEVIPLCDDVVKVDPTRAVKARMLKGQAFEKMERWTEAAQAYVAAGEAAGITEDERVTAWARTAENYERLKRWDDAIVCYQRIAKETTQPAWKIAAEKRLELLQSASGAGTPVESPKPPMPEELLKKEKNK